MSELVSRHDIGRLVFMISVQNLDDYFAPLKKKPFYSKFAQVYFCYTNILTVPFSWWNFPFAVVPLSNYYVIITVNGLGDLQDKNST